MQLMIDDVYGIIDMLFEWQYKVTETVTTETRSRTETREDTRLVTDPDTGRSYWERYTYEVTVPYAYTTCTVTLEAEILSHAPVYIMSREKMGMYALYMSTLGNMPHLFSGPHASTLKDPLVYDVPQELLDADPQFALLVEEANKRLGYPYVWGGYDPSTSFDCSGFISWVFINAAGDTNALYSIGHGTVNQFNNCELIEESFLQVGDLVFAVGGDGVCGHVGMVVLYPNEGEILFFRALHGVAGGEIVGMETVNPFVWSEWRPKTHFHCRVNC